ncbi:hypothetical protein EH025_11095 [Salmonella enterica]|nr:hypothetical protein [Salmonella enterica]EBN1954123.1 hypothetical protein [Salmonella enterica]ECW1641665.1 hypothetical protein [Salmonella enterica]
MGGGHIFSKYESNCICPSLSLYETVTRIILQDRRSQTIQTKADVGGTTKQSVFYISDISIQRLETEPEKIMSECEKLQRIQKKSCAQKDMARLYKSFGEEGVLELLRNACSANDASPSGEQKAG